MGKPHILLIEDEASIAEPLVETLERDGFTAEVAGTIADAGVRFARREPDCLLVDVMLPDGDGRDFCRHVRRSSDVPIIMLTARGEEMDKVLALELGADDYVVKPFSARELIARIRAILRRGRAEPKPSPIEIRGVRIDPAAHTVTHDGKPIDLTPREFDLLWLLMRHAGEVVRREDIMDEVWDPHWFGSTKTLDVHISWLRKKLHDDSGSPRYVATVRGVGFRFAAPDDEPAGPAGSHAD